MNIRSLVRAAAWACPALGLTTGCSSLGYYAQSVGGQLKPLSAARPVPDLPADAGTSDELEERLALTQRVCDFAVTALNLPDNASHRRCADLQRGAAVRDVVVAPELPAPLRADHVALKASARQGYIGYDGRFAQVNNASFGVLAACTERMPHFERLLVAQGGDLLRLYALGSAPRGLSDGRAAATPAGSGFRLIGVNAFP